MTLSQLYGKVRRIAQSQPRLSEGSTARGVVLLSLKCSWPQGCWIGPSLYRQVDELVACCLI